jgi:hypothetical protein
MIARELGEMKICLKPCAKLMRQRIYRLNPKYKEKVKVEIGKMLDAWIIEPMVESEWIIPMVVQDKKIGGSKIFLDMRKLRDACMHDPFPTSFTDEVMENVGGKEAYSFTNGFSAYH